MCFICMCAYVQYLSAYRCIIGMRVSTCLGSKVCAAHFPTLILSLFTPAWQGAPVHVVINNSHWPSALLTFTCYELIMTSSVVWLISLCGTQNSQDYYDDFRLCCYVVILLYSTLWRLIWLVLLLCFVKNNLYSGSDRVCFDGKDVNAVVVTWG